MVPPHIGKNILLMASAKSGIEYEVADGGVIVNLGVRRDGDIMVLNTDLTDPNQTVAINRNTIEQLVVSKTSPMPSGLFNRMTKDEILDLTGYLISGGDSGFLALASR